MLTVDEREFSTITQAALRAGFKTFAIAPMQTLSSKVAQPPQMMLLVEFHPNEADALMQCLRRFLLDVNNNITCGWHAELGAVVGVQTYGIILRPNHLVVEPNQAAYNAAAAIAVGHQSAPSGAPVQPAPKPRAKRKGAFTLQDLNQLYKIASDWFASEEGLAQQLHPGHEELDDVSVEVEDAEGPLVLLHTNPTDEHTLEHFTYCLELDTKLNVLSGWRRTELCEPCSRERLAEDNYADSLRYR